MILETEGLVKEYDGVLAVDSLDFSLQDPEIRAVIGPNGAGKTTFFDLITGRVQPTAGTIRFKSTDITNWPPHRIAESIGRKFQITNLYDDFTVKENLLVADQARDNRVLTSLRRHTPSEEIETVLETIGLADRKDTLASELAYGERQWLEIGMVMLNQPELLLLDEPTSGMTGAETERTAELIREFAAETPILLVEHNIDFIYGIADTITVLHQGQKLAEGTPDEIMTDDRVRRVYIGEDHDRNDVNGGSANDA